MGRTPRLVNPDDGPLEAFAHDLRLLREKAGNPTYRALAKTAGFSPSTLGEAAGGVRRPSLDVTLAFVGACGGDVAAWQQRWHQLDRRLTAEQVEQAGQAGPDGQDAQVDAPGPAASADAADMATAYGSTDPTAPTATVGSAGSAGSDHAFDPDLPQPAGPDPVPGPSGARPRRARHALIAAGALTAISALAFAGVRWGTDRANASTNPAHTLVAHAAASASPSHCVVLGPKGLFGGDTRGAGARIRAGASMADTVVRTISGNCSLQFDGYCLGDVVADPMGGTPDMRWFEVSGGGVVSSAVIHGNPPAGLKPSACPDSVPPPSSIALSTSHDSPGAFELHATGVHVWIVGFATVPDDRSGGPVPATAKWQQIGMVGSTSAGFTLAWSARPPGSSAQPGPGGVPSASPAAERLPIVAVACFGGEGATDVMDLESVSVADPKDATPLALTAAQRAAAAKAACSYPRP